jgi:hypothetical protein
MRNRGDLGAVRQWLIAHRSVLRYGAVVVTVGGFAAGEAEYILGNSSVGIIRNFRTYSLSMRWRDEGNLPHLSAGLFGDQAAEAASNWRTFFCEPCRAQEGLALELTVSCDQPCGLQYTSARRSASALLTIALPTMDSSLASASALPERPDLSAGSLFHYYSLARRTRFNYPGVGPSAEGSIPKAHWPRLRTAMPPFTASR